MSLLGIQPYLKTLWASHPFSTVMATSVVFILMVRLDHPIDIVFMITLEILLIQILTGLINDFLDFDMDKIYQKKKPLVQKIVNKEKLWTMILFLSLVALVVVTFLPRKIIIVIIIGGLIAQSYNFGFKDHPVSIIIFQASFGLMALIPFILIENFEISKLPRIFLLSGAIIASVLHIANDLVDYNTDSARGGKPFVVWIGMKKSFYFLILLSIVFTIIQWGQIFIILLNLFAILIIIFGNQKSEKIRENVYFISVFCYVIILLIIPLNK